MTFTETLKEVKPTIAAQWHPTLNHPLTPDQVFVRSTEEVWWKCDQGHEWFSSIVGRRGDGKKKASCPVCKNILIVKGVNDFASQLPEIVQYWDHNKNTVLPEEISRANTSKEHFWKCPQDHEWQTSVKAMSLRKKGYCLICSKSQVVSGVNDLATTHPHLIPFWDKERNSRQMDTVTSNTHYRAAWKCPVDHDWQFSIHNQLNQEPICNQCFKEEGKFIGEVLNSQELLSKGYDHIIIKGKKVKIDVILLLENHWDNSNGVLSVHNLENHSWVKEISWECPNGHSYLHDLSSKMRKRGCPVCSGRRTISGINDVLTKFPELRHQIDPEDTDNPDLSNLPVSSRESILWTCSEGHKYAQSVASKVRHSVHSCKVCAGKETQAGVNDLMTTHPELMSTYWHPTKNLPLVPEQFSRGSHTKVWWKCNNGHEWEGAIQHLVISGRRCPTCAGKTVQTGFNDAGTKYPKIIDSWHPTKNAGVSIHEIGSGIDDPFWWKCEKGHEWETSARNRGALGTGCPSCGYNVSKGEQEVMDFVASILSPTVEILSNDRKTIKQELDIYIPVMQIAIEYNGVYWHSEKNPKITRDYHHDKWLACKQAGIQLIQIWEDEWITKTETVKAMLAHKLGVSTQRRVPARKTTVQRVTAEVARNFYETNHIQGFASSTHSLALVERGVKEGTTVAILGLRIEKDGTTQGKGNIVRYATSANVVGGFSKLLTYIEREFSELSSLYTFSDNCVSDGGLYENNGFIAVRELAPDYMYVVNNKRQHKFGYRLKRFRTDPDLLWEEGLSERELALLNEIPRIWDAGKTKWEKRLG